MSSELRRGMEIFEERARKAGIDLALYGGRIPAELMLRLGIPLIVACTKCGMTMSGFEALGPVVEDRGGGGIGG